MADNESRLVYECMRELGKHGHVVRCNAGNARLPDGRLFRGMPKGWCDIMLFLPGGKACFIECKVGRNRLSKEQEKLLQRMCGLGFTAGVARSVNEAMALCNLVKPGKMDKR